MTTTANTANTDAPEPTFDRKWMPAWLNAYVDKGTVTAACKVVRIGRTAVYAAKERDPEFAAEWEKADSEQVELLEKTLYEIAVHGTGNPQMRALEFALKAKRPERYRENKISIDHGGSVSVEVNEKVNAELEKAHGELDRLTARLAQVADRGETAAPGPRPGGQVAPAS